MQNKQTNKPMKKKNLIFVLNIIFLTALILTLHYLNFPHYYLGWIAFAIACFSVAGNDAIQTVGTFIESKKKLHWFPKVFMLCGLVIGVFTYGYIDQDHEIHFNLLSKFEEPKDFNPLQLLAPIVLVIITRLKAPISTTFLILGLFSTSKTGNIEKMLNKSFLGYGIAFISAMAFWGIHAFFYKKEYQKGFEPKPKKEKKWARLQWLSTAILWVAWLLQDSANIAIYLPRKLNIYEFLMAISILSSAIGFIIYSNGGAIQEVVSEKSDITYSKAATLVDFAYASVLILFKVISNIPMSTTWLFLGLLAGREIILHLITKQDKPYLQTFRQVGKDVVLASLGITVSMGVYLLSLKMYPPKEADKPKTEIIEQK